RQDGLEADVYFARGNIVHAALGDSEGEEVVYKILAWQDGEFNLETGIRSPGASIRRSWSSLLLGHTRLPTKGSPALTANNHPLRVGPVLLVHNGHIQNDDELFAAYRFPRQGQVDSEILLHLIGTCPPELDTIHYLDAVGVRLQAVQGDVAFIACDARAPGRVLVYKRNNPLCLHWNAGWNGLVFSSRYIFIRKAFGHSVAAEALAHNQLMLFDANTLPTHGPNPLETLSLLPQLY
ncbi:MAG: DUF4388 domain-containing protein, partial [Anaerolineae bacterium]